MITNFPTGVSSFGMPLSGAFPLTGSRGRVFYVDSAVGSDDNDGSFEAPFDTIAEAYSRCTSGYGDIVFLLNDGGTTGTARDVAITWAKNNTHLIGLCAPGLNQRARISPATTATDVDAYTPYITLSASGCVFSNFSIFQGNSEDSKASVGIKVSGSRNYFNNVGIITGAHANQGDEATYQLQVTGSENVFEYCYIGQDTAAAGNNAAYANLRFGSGAADEATRNIFRHCYFPMFADDTEPCFVRVVGLTDISRWNLFEDCVFINTGTSTLDAGVVSPGSVTGKLFFKDCAFYGCTDVTAADSSDVLMYGISGASVVEVGLFKGVDIA